MEAYRSDQLGILLQPLEFMEYLLEWLQANAPHQVEDAWRDMKHRGTGWTSRFKTGAKGLEPLLADAGPMPWN